MFAEAREACRSAAEEFDCTVEAARRLPRDPDAVRPIVGRARADERAGSRRRRRRADPERAAARRDRDRPGRADGDDLRPVRPADLARLDRGLARAGAERRDRCVREDGGLGACQSGGNDDQREPFSHELRSRPPNQPAGGARDRARSEGRDVRLHERVDVRLPPAVGGAVRDLQPDPRRHAQVDCRADGDQSGDPRLDRHGLAVRHAE